MIEYIKKGIIPVGAYCAPQCPSGNLKNRITLEQYKIAKDCGVNIMYGHSEVFGTKTEKYVFDALEICERVGMTYYVRDAIASEYIEIVTGDKTKAFVDLSEDEKKDLNERFKRNIGKYSRYKSFGGIIFADEPGYESFDGISEAKKVFKSVCPDKTFYVNMYPYYVTPEQYQFGFRCSGIDRKSDIEEFRIVEGGRNIERYKFLYDEYIKKVNPEIFSYDAYPFITIGTMKTGVHEILWEMPQFLHERERENGIPYAVFLQAGGLWEGDIRTRIPTMGEVKLGISIPLLYGAKCLQIFPYMFPNDWQDDKVAYAGIVDANGNKTEFFDYYKQAFRQVGAIGGYLLKANIKGVIKNGEYSNGLPTKEEIKKIQWSECVYQGELPECGNIEISPQKPLLNVESKTQALIGVLSIDGVDAYFAVNNSSTEENEITCAFDGAYNFEIICDGVTKEKQGDKITVRLSAGDNALIIRRE